MIASLRNIKWIPENFAPARNRTGAILFSLLIFTAAAAIGILRNSGVKLRIHDVEVLRIQMLLRNPERFAETGGWK